MRLVPERLHLLYLVCALLLAASVFARQKSFTPRAFLRFVFPREVYLHASARVDYVFFLVNRIVLGLPLLALGFAATLGGAQGSSAALNAVFGASSMRTSPILETLLAAAAYDLGLFVAHYCQHRVPWLWEFHKVHHSAAVLTPITAYRMHPMDDVLSALCSGMLSGIVVGAFQFADPGRPGALTVLGVNACFFLFYAAGFNLRHSHVWLSYGPLLSRIFVSPAQHQVHHSNAERHWDRNYGFMLALWDRLAGTLYVPRGYEEIVYGLPDGEDAAYASVPALYALPFKRVFRQRP